MTRTLPTLLLALSLGACSGTPNHEIAVPRGSGATATTSDFDPAQLAAAGVDVASLRCNRENTWSSRLAHDAADGATSLMAELAPAFRELTSDERTAAEKAIRKALMWRMVRAVLVGANHNNLGAIVLRGHEWTDETGRARPVIVFRTGLTPEPDAPDSCFRSLLDAGDVRHVVNLFDGDIPAADLVAAEERAAAEFSATYRSAPDDDETSRGYGPWRDQLRRHFDDPVLRDAATRSVARLVRETILRPAGLPHRGNVLVHCGGGMHRTGMVIGIVEKCINREPFDVVEAHYKTHVAWRDPEHPGGYEAGNIRFLKEFNCRLVTEP